MSLYSTLLLLLLNVVSAHANWQDGYYAPGYGWKTDYVESLPLGEEDQTLGECARICYEHSTTYIGARWGAKVGIDGVTESDPNNCRCITSGNEDRLTYRAGKTIVLFKSWSELPDIFIDSNQNPEYTCNQNDNCVQGENFHNDYTVNHFKKLSYDQYPTAAPTASPTTSVSIHFASAHYGDHMNFTESSLVHHNPGGFSYSDFSFQGTVDTTLWYGPDDTYTPIIRVGKGCVTPDMITANGPQNTYDNNGLCTNNDNLASPDRRVYLGFELPTPQNDIVGDDETRYPESESSSKFDDPVRLTGIDAVRYTYNYPLDDVRTCGGTEKILNPGGDKEVKWKLSHSLIKPKPYATNEYFIECQEMSYLATFSNDLNAIVSFQGSLVEDCDAKIMEVELEECASEGHYRLSTTLYLKSKKSDNLYLTNVVNKEVPTCTTWDIDATEKSYYQTNDGSYSEITLKSDCVNVGTPCSNPFASCTDYSFQAQFQYCTNPPNDNYNECELYAEDNTPGYNAGNFYSISINIQMDDDCPIQDLGTGTSGAELKTYATAPITSSSHSDTTDEFELYGDVYAMMDMANAGTDPLFDTLEIIKVVLTDPSGTPTVLYDEYGIVNNLQDKCSKSAQQCTCDTDLIGSNLFNDNNLRDAIHFTFTDQTNNALGDYTLNCTARLFDCGISTRSTHAQSQIMTRSSTITLCGVDNCGDSGHSVVVVSSGSSSGVLIGGIVCGVLLSGMCLFCFWTNKKESEPETKKNIQETVHLIIPNRFR